MRSRYRRTCSCSSRKVCKTPRRKAGGASGAGRWIAQRWFEVERDAAGEAVNYGVFLVAGEASGLYLRASSGPTDAGALSVPALVRAE